MSAPETLKISVNDLLHQANDAMDKMSNDNPHKRLISYLGQAMQALGKKCAAQSTLLKEIHDSDFPTEERYGDWHAKIDALEGITYDQES